SRGLSPDLHSFPTRRSSDLEAAGALDVHGPALMDDRPGEVVATADVVEVDDRVGRVLRSELEVDDLLQRVPQHRAVGPHDALRLDRKSTRLNSSHLGISYAV